MLFVKYLATLTLLAASSVLAASLVAILNGLSEGRALALLSVAYSGIGIWILRAPRISGWIPSWAIPAGLVVAALELANICLEQFIGLPSPANAVVPASMMAFMVLASSTAAVVASGGDSPFRGTVAAITVLGLGMLLSVSVVLVVVAVRAALHPALLPLLQLTCSNATIHLTLPLLVAAIAGSAASAISAVASHRPRRIAVLISVAGFLVFAVGVRLLVVAASLPRPDRPPLVMPGMALSALGLVLVPTPLGRRTSR